VYNLDICKLIAATSELSNFKYDEGISGLENAKLWFLFYVK